LHEWFLPSALDLQGKIRMCRECVKDEFGAQLSEVRGVERGGQEVDDADRDWRSALNRFVMLFGERVPM